MRIFFFFAWIFLASLALPVQAAEYYFGANSQAAPADGLFTVGVFLNTQGERINALQGTITVPSSLAVVQSVEEGNSIINLWLQSPAVTCNADCRVSFRGIIPGGFLGNDGYLFSLILAGRGTGELSLDMVDAQALRNDGSGTAAKLSIRPLTLALSPSANAPYLATIDHTPPESFTPVLAYDPNLFHGEWFMSFSTTDKGSGVDHYEVRETSRILFRSFFPQWKTVDSPYILQDQTLRSSFFVRAVDRSGNTMTSFFAAPRAPLWYADDRIWSFIFALVILLPIVWRIFALWHRERFPSSHD